MRALFFSLVLSLLGGWAGPVHAAIVLTVDAGDGDWVFELTDGSPLVTDGNAVSWGSPAGAVDGQSIFFGYTGVFEGQNVSGSDAAMDVFTNASNDISYVVLNFGTELPSGTTFSKINVFAPGVKLDGFTLNAPTDRSLSPGVAGGGIDLTVLAVSELTIPEPGTGALLLGALGLLGLRRRR